MKKIQALMAAMLLPWLLSGCVLRTQGGESLETRVERLEKTTAETKATADQTKETLDRNVGSMAESSVYFENMRQEFAEMKGAFEENKFSQNKYTNDYQNLKAYLDQEFAKIDKRLQVLEDKAGIRTTDTYAALPADLGDVPVAKKSEKELFEEALLEFKKQRYTSSEKKFKDFLRQYAKSDKADAAKFYVGESLFKQKKYTDAILEYDEMTSRYPKSAHAPQAVLNQAISFEQLGQKFDAKLFYEKVISAYPKSDQAKAARKS